MNFFSIVGRPLCVNLVLEIYKKLSHTPVPIHAYARKFSTYVLPYKQLIIEFFVRHTSYVIYPKEV